MVEDTYGDMWQFSAETLAHELGHNFGAGHDIDAEGSPCDPSKYVERMIASMSFLHPLLPRISRLIVLTFHLPAPFPILSNNNLLSSSQPPPQPPYCSYCSNCSYRSYSS